MKFYLNKLILWMKDEKTKILEFKPNKVNVITGKSNTGKTTIFEIIDYCFFASHSDIPDSIINENIKWYGINYNIGNGREQTIARGKLINGKVSKEYYFSSTGEITEKFPVPNIDESSLRELLEAEYNIDSKVTIPFGGKSIIANSKISLRYFNMFNTISDEIITSRRVFFDKQSQNRYREALPRIFDLAVGIDTIKNIVLREKKEGLEKELLKLESKIERKNDKKIKFENEIEDIIIKAKKYGIISPDIQDSSDAVNMLKAHINDIDHNLTTEGNGEVYKIQKSLYSLNLKLRNINKFESEYKEYANTLKTTIDSLKPIEYLNNHKNELVQTSFFKNILDVLESDLELIRLQIKKNAPINFKISELKNKILNEIKLLKEKLSKYPSSLKSLNNDKEKYIFLGEIKATLELFSEDKQVIDKKACKYLKDKIESIHVKDIREQKELFKDVLEENIHNLMSSTSDVLENYKNYLPFFDYTNQKLQLRKPQSEHIESPGSSSNHMFLHLYLFLGLQKVIQQKGIKYIPSWLLIDQPSRPYWSEDKSKWDDETLKVSDVTKIKKAFSLLDEFISTMQEDDIPFQIIVLEHVQYDIWGEFKNVHIVDQFFGTNALIPQEYINKEIEHPSDDDIQIQGELF